MTDLIFPSPDDIFRNFVAKASDKDIEKKFGIKKPEVSAAESVKNVDK